MKKWTAIYDDNGNLLALFYIEYDASGKIVGYKLQKKITRGTVGGVDEVTTWSTKSMHWEMDADGNIINMTKSYIECTYSVTDLNGDGIVQEDEKQWSYSNYTKTTTLAWEKNNGGWGIKTYNVQENGTSYSEQWEKVLVNDPTPGNPNSGDETYEWVHKQESSIMSKERSITFNWNGTKMVVSGYTSTSQTSGIVDWDAYTDDGNLTPVTTSENNKHQTPWSVTTMNVVYVNGEPSTMTYDMRGRQYDDAHPGGFYIINHRQSTWNPNLNGSGKGGWDTPDLNTSINNYCIVSPLVSEGGYTVGTWYFYDPEADEGSRWLGVAPSNYWPANVPTPPSTPSSGTPASTPPPSGLNLNAGANTTASTTSTEGRITQQPQALAKTSSVPHLGLSRIESKAETPRENISILKKEQIEAKPTTRSSTAFGKRAPPLPGLESGFSAKPASLYDLKKIYVQVTGVKH